MSRDIDQITKDVYLCVIFNWANISSNSDVMQALDMEQNSLCRNYKLQNPGMRDAFIQAHVFTMLLMMFYIVSQPIQNPFSLSTPLYEDIMYETSNLNHGQYSSHVSHTDSMNGNSEVTNNQYIQNNVEFNPEDNMFMRDQNCFDDRTDID